jgi:hypothetical protein
VRARLERERTYRKYPYACDEATQDRIEKAWGRFIGKWGYERIPVMTSGAGGERRSA